MRNTVLLLVLCLASGSVCAEDDTKRPLAITAIVDAVLEAVAENETAALDVLAKQDVPDPWIVADEICRRGEFDAAIAFAKSGTRPETQRMAEYIESHQALMGEAAALEALTTLRVELTYAYHERDSGDLEGALKRLGPFVEGRDHVLGCAAALFRAELLDQLHRVDEAIPEFERTATRSEAIGWGVLASEALYQAGRRLHAGAYYERAVAVFERELQLERDLESPMGVGRGHFRVAASLHALGRIDDANAHRQEARRLASESGDRLYTAKLMVDDGVTLARSNQVDAAIEVFARSAQLLKDLDLGGYPPRFRPTARQVAESRVGALTNACSMSASVGRSADAKKFARKALSASKSAGDERVVDEARALVARIDAAADMAAGRHYQALGQLDRARGLYVRLGVRDELADVLRRLGDLRMALSDLPAALACYEEAIEILEDAGAVRLLVPAHRGAGNVCDRLGRGREALPHLEASLRLSQSLRDPVLVAGALNSLAAFHRGHSEFGRAFELLTEAMQIHREFEGRTDKTATLLQLAHFHADRGEVEVGLRYMEQVVKLRAASPHVFDLASARQQKATFLHRQGKLTEALAELELALAARRGGGSRSDTASVLMSIGRLRLGRYEEGDAEAARDFFDEAVGMYVAAEDEGWEIAARIQLGRAYAWMDDHEGALEELSYALERANEVEDVTSQAATYAALAEAHYHNKTDREAILAAFAGAQLIASFALDQAEGDRDIARAQFEPLIRWGAAAALRSGHAIALYEFLERGRATALVASMGGRAAIREAQVPRALRDAEDDAKAGSAIAYEAYAAARRDEAPRSVQRALREALDRARAKQRIAVSAIQREVRSQADLVYSSPVGPGVMQASLAPDEAFVSYGMDGWRYFALVTMQKQAFMFELASAKVVDAAVEAVIADPGDAVAVTRLEQLIIDPVREYGDRKRWLVSPHGLLAYVPFGLVAPERDVCLLPSATTLHLLRQAEQTTGDKVLAVGDPSYDNQLSLPTPAVTMPGSNFRGTALVPLPGTRAEATAVGNVVLLGEDASETRFREVVATEARWRAIHMACHGILDDVVATQSALALARDDENDGFLEANEVVTQLRISADLVVLSGCETGRGRIRAGEGLQGLSRAFMLAGTPRVLASLWKVDDDATRELMLKFYELWNPADRSKGLRAPEALRKAQEHVRAQKQWTHPRYWAAWVLWGLPD